eukprot:gene10137-45228_t
MSSKSNTFWFYRHPVISSKGTYTHPGTKQHYLHTPSGAAGPHLPSGQQQQRQQQQDARQQAQQQRQQQAGTY